MIILSFKELLMLPEDFLSYAILTLLIGILFAMFNCSYSFWVKNKIYHEKPKSDEKFDENIENVFLNFFGIFNTMMSLGLLYLSFHFFSLYYESLPLESLKKYYQYILLYFFIGFFIYGPAIYRINVFIFKHKDKNKDFDIVYRYDVRHNFGIIFYYASLWIIHLLLCLSFFVLSLIWKLIMSFSSLLYEETNEEKEK